MVVRQTQGSTGMVRMDLVVAVFAILCVFGVRGEYYFGSTATVTSERLTKDRCLEVRSGAGLSRLAADLTGMTDAGTAGAFMLVTTSDPTCHPDYATGVNRCFSSNSTDVGALHYRSDCTSIGSGTTVHVVIMSADGTPVVVSGTLAFNSYELNLSKTNMIIICVCGSVGLTLLFCLLCCCVDRRRRTIIYRRKSTPDGRAHSPSASSSSSSDAD